MVRDNETIGIGVQTNNETGVDVDADAYGYADDGEHAVVYAVEEEHSTLYWVSTIYCEAGLCDLKTEKDRLAVDDPTTAEAAAKELAESNPDGELKGVRDYWADK